MFRRWDVVKFINKKIYKDMDTKPWNFMIVEVHNRDDIVFVKKIDYSLFEEWFNDLIYDTIPLDCVTSPTIKYVSKKELDYFKSKMFWWHEK